MPRLHPARLKAGAAFVAVAAASALALAGCSADAGATDSASTVLNLRVPSQPTSLDPANANNGPQLAFQQLAYASLINVDADGEYIPGLATEWGYVGEGNMTYDLTLRSDAEFADGTAVDAEAVANSLNYYAKNATNASSSAFSTITATAVDEDTVELTSTVANPQITELLSPRSLAGNIISAAGLADPDALAAGTFGAGAYVLDAEQSVTGDHYTFVPNENYYDQDGIHYDEVVLKVISDGNAAFQALQAGQVDVLFGDPNNAEAATSAGLDVVTAPGSWENIFLVDRAGSLVPALGDVRVRQALNYALDRDAIATAVYGEYGAADYQPNTPGFDGYDESLDSIYAYDVDKAKSLLAEAGYADGFTLPIVYPSYSTGSANTVQAVASQLAEIGVTVELVASANDAEYGQNINSKSYPAYIDNWAGQNQYANTTSAYLKDAPNNLFSVETPGLEDAFTAYATATQDDADAAAKAVEKILVEQAVGLPVIQVENVIFSSPSVEGVALSTTGRLSNPIFYQPSGE